MVLVYKGQNATTHIIRKMWWNSAAVTTLLALQEVVVGFVYDF